jgi:tRNA nucleotidyltransferase (CCA-adding enzyme)
MKRPDAMNNQPLTVITSHINPDYDAIASMLAAQKLYPDALVVFPDLNDKNLRNFFIQSLIYLFNMVDAGTIDLSAVERLVVVDTRQKRRIPQLKELLTRSDLEIHVYDHHPPSEDDLQPTMETIEMTGSTVTILAHLIKAREIDLSPDEATMMGLGLYEDTGSFTFSSTTEKDFTAAAYLLSRGANINTISSLLAKEITPVQIALLNDMIQSSVSHRINGVEIILTNLSTPEYIPDLASLVQKMMRMENLEALFTIARMGKKIYVVARSRIAEVDTGTILQAMGGGGHAFAASATIKGKTMAQVEQRLLGILYRKVKSRQQAKDLMTAPAISIPPDTSCRKAGDILTRYNINALLITLPDDEEDQILGYISRQVIEKALYHHLGDVPVQEYMTTELDTAQPESELPEIQQKIIDNDQSILPIVRHGRLLGVVTRMDLLNILVYHQKRRHIMQTDEGSDKPMYARTRRLLPFMQERLSETILQLLASIGQTADLLDYGAYIVGGFVRDLLLYRKNDDLDIVIEGDGIAFAEQLSREFGARLHTHRKFGTAIVTLPDGMKIDIATARMEYYTFPAALPTVEMSSIKLDLCRRDFTINTLAIKLNPDEFGTLIDFFSGQRDLKDKVIRVLHNLSFVEDPTRAFRAVRFEQRFNFKIGKLTAGLIKNAVKMNFFKQVSGPRVFTELRYILEEENPVAALLRLMDYDLLTVLHPDLTYNKKHLISMLESTVKIIAWHDLLFLDEPCMNWLVYFMVLLRQLGRQMANEICERLHFPPRIKHMLIKERLKAEIILHGLEHHLPGQNSELYQRLTGFKPELILYMMVITNNEETRKAISHYYTRLRNIRISLKGADLKVMGVPPGPVYREILQSVLDRKLNGLLKTREDELAYVKQHLSSFLPERQTTN